MKEENFCYWLRGFFELLEAGPKQSSKLVLTAEQVEIIEKHLKSVFQEKIMEGTQLQFERTPLADLPPMTMTTTPIIC